jgi:hypothetical protein
MPPLARSNEEAHLYMDLHPCSCGGRDASRDSAVGLDGDTFVVRYTCVCGTCGRQRTYEFREPDVPARPADGGWSAGPQPSELLDAGEWLWVADRFGRAPAEPDGLTPAEVGQARSDLAAAAAAVDETLKFLPPGAAAVPDGAFWSERGRQVRVGAPERFARASLEATRDSYRAVREALAR